MAEITQKLGYDVSQGVAALGQLRSALGQVNTASRNLSNLNSQFGNVGRTGARSFNLINEALSSTLGFLGRDLIRGALREIGDLFRDAAEGAAELQKAVAEVATISGGVGFSELTDSVRELSNELGRPTVEVAEAAYQAFSNQVVQTEAELESFIQTAGRLASATAAEQADAVGVLSSVINSYGENVSEASNISDDLFTIVEEGRTRLSEFANSLGTVTPLAAELGISFQEVGASLAAITRSGTTTSVALTQIRGILNKLQKPTEALDSVLRSLGFESFQQLSDAAGGFIPALQQLIEQGDALGFSQAELFGRVRATAGVLNLLRDDAEAVTDILSKLEDNAGAAGEAFEQIESTDARQAERALQRLNNIVEEFGDGLVAVRADFLQFLAEAIPDVETLVGVLATAGAAAVALGVGLAGAVIPAGALAAAIGTIGVASGIFIPLAGAIVAATVLIREQRLETDRLREGYNAAGQAAIDAANAAVEATQESIQAATEAASAARSGLQDAYSGQLADARQANDQTRASFQGVIDAFVASRERVIQQIRSAITTAENEIAASAGRLRSITQELEDISFERSIQNLSEQQQQARSLQRALRTAAESRRELANAGLDQEAARNAIATRQRALQQLAEAERRAASTESERDDRQVAQARERLLRQFASDERRRQSQLREIRENDAKTAERALQNQIELAEQLLQTFKNSASALDLTNALDSVQEYDNRLKDALGTAEQIFQRLNVDPTGGFADQVGAGDELRQGTQNTLEGVVDFAGQSEQIRNSLQGVLDSNQFQAVVDAELNITNLESLLGEQQAGAAFDNLRAQLQTQLTQVAADLTIDAPIGVQIEQQLIRGGKAVAEFATGAEAVDSAYDQLTQSISGSLQNLAQFDEAQVSSAQAALEQAQAAAESAAEQGRLSDASLEAVQSAIETGRAALETQGQILQTQAERVRQAGTDTSASINNATQAMNGLATGATNAASAAVSINSNVQPISGSLASATGQARQLEQALLRAARAAASVRASGGGGGAAFFGKSIKRQTGGATRGQDSVLTATSPGEFVVNAKSARRFRSQLTAINAGQSAQSREQGGSVTNVGDISVNIQTPDAAAVSGRSIARELNREIRTRGSKLFNS